jgi:thiol-disulfide isomerase/thioredoxin
MRYLFALLLAALLLATPRAEAYELPKPKLIAAYFYADWCPNCKVFSPAWSAAREHFVADQQPILFVTLDLTDKPRIRQSVLLAQALGIGDFVKAQGSATGYAAVLDATSKKELARFDRTADSAAITKKIDQLLGN